MIITHNILFYDIKHGIHAVNCKVLVSLLRTSRSSCPTDVLWPCHTLLGSPACLKKYLAVLKLSTKYFFADPYANNTNLLYQI